MFHGLATANTAFAVYERAATVALKPMQRIAIEAFVASTIGLKFKSRFDEPWFDELYKSGPSISNPNPSQANPGSPDRTKREEPRSPSGQTVTPGSLPPDQNSPSAPDSVSPNSTMPDQSTTPTARRKRDLLAPFGANGEFQQLTVESCEMFELPDPAWTDYQHDGDKEAVISKHALFFRSIFVPSLASALTRVREGDAEVVAAFSNQVEQRLKRRLASHPAPMHSFVQTVILAKAKED